MEEIVKQVRSIVHGMWKYRWAAVAAAWLISIVGVIVVFKIPNQYEASARIYVDTQSILKPLMAGLTVQPNVEQQIGMLSRTLISRPNLEKLIRMADVDLRSDSKLAQETLIERLARDIQIRNTGRDNLYSLVYRDTDPEKAKRVVQSLVSIFVESSLGATRKDSDSARTFLNEQIKQYEAKLEEAETRVKEFRLRNLDLQADGKDASTRIAELSAQLQAAQLQLREAENSRDAAKAQLASERTEGLAVTIDGLQQQAGVSLSTPELDARIDTQKRNLDALRQRYTDQHPDVITTLRLISELEAQKKKELAELQRAARAAAAANPAVTGAQSSLAAQELSRMIASAEVQVAALRTRVNEFSARLVSARESLKVAPQIEAEAAQLNRDYAIIKKNYEDLVARRQSAIMSGELEVASGVADFRLIDPPRVTPKPVSPNRLLLMPLPLLAGLGAGLFIAFAASQLRPTFLEPSDLRAKTGLPVLGVVSVVMNDTDRRSTRMSLYRFMGASGGLIFVFAAGLTAMALTGRLG